MDKNVFALDLGSTIGWSLVDPKGRFEIGGEMELIGENRAQKLQHFMSWLDMYLTDNAERIEFVIFERPFTRGLPATRMLWGYAGIVEALATEYGFAVVDELPTSIKKFATGSGKASKETMIEIASEKAGLELGEHESDAYLLGLYAVTYLESK